MGLANAWRIRELARGPGPPTSAAGAGRERPSAADDHLDAVAVHLYVDWDVGLQAVATPVLEDVHVEVVDGRVHEEAVLAARLEQVHRVVGSVEANAGRVARAQLRDACPIPGSLVHRHGQVVAPCAGRTEGTGTVEHRAAGEVAGQAVAERRGQGGAALRNDNLVVVAQLGGGRPVVCAGLLDGDLIVVAVLEDGRAVAVHVRDARYLGGDQLRHVALAHAALVLGHDNLRLRGPLDLSGGRLDLLDLHLRRRRLSDRDILRYCLDRFDYWIVPFYVPLLSSPVIKKYELVLLVKKYGRTKI